MTEYLRCARWGHVDIVFSPDDNGWYAQRWSDDATTTIYANKQSLLEALATLPEQKWSKPPPRT